MEETQKHKLEEKVLKAGAIIKINIPSHENKNYYVVNVDSNEIKALELSQENLTLPRYNYIHFLRRVYEQKIDILENIEKLEIRNDSFVDKNAYNLLQKYIT